MLTKTPQKVPFSSKMKTLIGIGIVSELAFVGVSLVYFRKMNADIDYRKRIYTEMPRVSKWYYDAMEYIPQDKTSTLTLRQRDYAAWGVTEGDK